MSDSFIQLPTDSTGKLVDTRTESTNSEHRQVMVLGDPTSNSAVAAVQATDPASNIEGVVVRDVNTSALAGYIALGNASSTFIAARIGQTLFVAVDPGHELGSIKGINSTVGFYLDSTQGTVAVQFKAGTLAVSLDPGHLLGSVTANAGSGSFTVQFDPGHTLGAITSINSVTTTVNVALDPGHTLGNIGTINSVTNTVAVFFSPANPAVAATFSGTVGVNIGKVDGTIQTIVGRIDDSVAIKSGTLTNITNTVNVQLDPGHTLGNIGTIASITGSVADYFDRGNPAVSATFSPSGTLAFAPITGSSHPMWEENYNAQRVFISGSNPNSSLIVNAGTGTFNVQLDPGHTLGSLISVGSITSTVGVNVGKIDGTVQVILDTRSSLAGIQSSIAVHLLSTAGTVAIKIDPGYNVVGTQATIVLPITTAGSTSGVSVSGVALAGPTASRVLKVFAFSITTTAQTSLTAKFTNGAGTSPTVFYETALQAPAQGISGTNMAVTPPGYIFATASGSTLCIVLDSASKVHYMVSYFEESA